MEDLVRIFVGTPANNEDLESQSVLEWSLRKHASQPLEITWMKLSKDPASFWYSDPRAGKGWVTRGWATPFSAFRWGVPAFCEFKGRAIYLDIDMIVQEDIAKLWHAPFNSGSFVIAKNDSTFCCSLFDCERAKKALPPIERIKGEYALYARLRREFRAGQVQPFPFSQNWNVLDGEHYHSLDDPEVKIIHCTSIPTQPQLKYALPRLKARGLEHWYKQPTRPHWRKDIIKMFDAYLEEAIAMGYPPDKYEAPVFGDYMRGV